MVKKQKLNFWKLALVSLYLLVFPFGPLPGFFIAESYQLPFNFHPSDLVLLLLVAFNTKALMTPKPKWLSSLYIFGLVSIFSWILAIFLFDFPSLRGLFYLIRLLAYIAFFHITWLTFSQNKFLKKAMLAILYIEALLIAVFGWLQYFLTPDLRYLKIWGWDDHYYRITGTFLDPAFTGILLVLGLLIGVYLYFLRKSKKYLLGNILLFLTLLFTYSRASYLALLVGLLIYLIKSGKRRLIFLFIAGLLLTLPLLPRPGGYGVRLERVHSIFLKIENYQESIEIFRDFPLLGIGYNNLCEYKTNILAFDNPGSHACSGLDNSFLLVLATTGVIGFVSFMWFLYHLWKSTEDSLAGILFQTSLSAIMIHTLFTNTFFYPWVLGWIAFLTAVSRNTKEST